MTARTEQIEKIAEELNCSLSAAKKKYYKEVIPSKWATEEEIAEEMNLFECTRTQAIGRITYRKTKKNTIVDGPDVVGTWQKTSQGWVLLKRNQ